MAVYDPQALEKMRSIYRDVVSRLSAASSDLEEAAFEMIAQDILRMVIANNRSREEIIAAVCTHVDAKRKSRRESISDYDDAPNDP